MCVEWFNMSPIPTQQRLARVRLLLHLLLCVNLSWNMQGAFWRKSSSKVVILYVPLMRWIMSMLGVFQLRLIWKDRHRMMRIVGMCQHLSMKGMKPCPQIWEKGKKLFLKNLNQIFQKILKSPSCWGAFCGNTKLVATGRMTKKGCDSCVQARGRTPARRRHHEGGDDHSPALTSMAADFTFVAGK